MNEVNVFNVLIIIQDNSLRDRVFSMLDSAPELNCLSYSGISFEFLKSPLKPDIILMDIDYFSESAGLDHIRSLHYHFPYADVVILSEHDDQEVLFDALRGGAVGYLLKSEFNPQNVLDIVNEIILGGAPMSRSIAKKLILSHREINKDWFTHRELEIIKFLADGLSNSEISNRLHLQHVTIKFHLRNIYHKLRVNNKTEAVIELKKRNLI